MKKKIEKPLISVVMGSKSDWDTMSYSCLILDKFKVSYEKKVLSAHRMPDDMFQYAEEIPKRGIKCIIAGAGGSAHLPGMIASKTILPVLGVPVESKSLKGLDSLLSIVQMPKGIPVATFAVGIQGASNAALFAVSLLSVENQILKRKLNTYRKNQTLKVKAMRI